MAFLAFFGYILLNRSGSAVQKQNRSGSAVQTRRKSSVFASVRNLRNRRDKMKVLAKEIILLLHDKGCNPTKTNFQGFWAQVEEILLWKSGLNRANVSEKSAKDVMESSHKFAKTCRKLYDRFGGKFDQYSEHEFFNQD